jgi:homoserine dehydrogenase
MCASRPPAGGPLEAYCTSGTSPGRPTLHLLGVGAVGRAFLRRLPADRVRLVAVSDTSGTLARPEGLSPSRVADLKERAGRVSPSVRPLAPGDVASIGADIVVDATSTVLGRSKWTDLLDAEVLDRKAHLVLAAKDGLRSRASAWTRASHAPLVRYNAVLGGAGGQLRDELPGLRDATRGVAIAGNATTTTIIDAIETGASLDEGIEVARRKGLLETDPELDFRGVDAALKLAIVVGALWGFPVGLDSVATDDVRELDVEEIRARAGVEHTTRLVARAERDGALRARFEQVHRGHWLDVPPDRVVYGYELAGGEVRVHAGDGLGAERTAAAVLYDVDQVVAERSGWRSGVGGGR